MSKNETRRTKKKAEKRRSVWMYYWAALPLALAFMVFEFLKTVG